MTGAGTDHTKPGLTGGPAIILVRPQLAVNIGMCARAMANFGLSDLRLVAPRDGWPRTDEHAETAVAAAAGASHLLDAATLFPDVPSAIADLNFVWATTARERGQQKRICVPAEAMPESAAAMAGGERHGILFGPERTGMDNDEIGAADAIMTFPVNPAYGSLNLAQAVLLVGYEWLRAAEGDTGRFAMRERSPPASREMVQSFFGFLEHELEWRGFFRPASKMPVMKRNLRNIFHRIGLTEQDVNTLRGLMVRLIEGPRGKANVDRLEATSALRQPEATGKRSEVRLQVDFEDVEINAMATQIAALAGETPIEAVRSSLRERLREEHRKRGTADGLEDELMEIAKRCAALPVLDHRSDEEIIGYDEHGLPT